MTANKSTEPRVTPRPLREEQAWREIAVTEFAPGVRIFLFVFFLAILIIPPLLQLLIPDHTYARLRGGNTMQQAAPAGVPISGTVAAISKPPDKNGVYRDFLMRIYLTDTQGVEGQEILLTVLGMKDRTLLPAAGLKKGDPITAVAQPWQDVAGNLASLNGSTLADDKFLLMNAWYGERVLRKGETGQPSGRDFLATWRGTGRAMASSWKGGHTPVERFLAANNALARAITLYDDELDDTSVLTLTLRSPVQAILTRLGVGNEKAYIGRDGWLFFRPDVVSLTGPAFLDPQQLRARARSSDHFSEPIQPDPRVAIIDFHNRLKARGIQLVVVPTPVKPSIHPAKLGHATGLVRNRSFDAFLADLAAAGVDVYDPAPLLESRAQQSPQYLRTDTHWTPQAMMAVASNLASHIAHELPDSPRPDWTLKQASFTQLGDIGALLDLPEKQTLIPPETAIVQMVADAAGNGWEPDPKADVLLLGDSFSNIYSLKKMGWGAHAGFGEHLAYALGRRLDRLSRNDAGAYASRLMLVEALQSDPHRLDGKRLVIWQFAERELALGDWKVLELPSERPAPAPPPPVPHPASHPVHLAPSVSQMPHAEPSPPETPQRTFAALAEEARANDAVAVVGKDDWIFLVSELRCLGSGPFWGEAAPSVNEDPFHAIVDLNAKLAELGIKLILCPAPPRAAIYPDRILDHTPKEPNGAPLRVDPTLQAFYKALREADVTVIDLTDDFLEARTDATQEPVCCEQDTHWSPRGLTLAARRVVKAFADDAWLEDVPKTSFTVHPPAAFSYVGDLVDRVDGHMQTERTATIVRVTEDKDGRTPLAFDSDSPVLLLADSHALVFSVGDDMHATGAGFGEIISAELGFPIDVMARRGSGDQVRIDLARRFLTKPGDAARKRIVIYTFAARTLTEGHNWKTVPLKK